MKMRLLGTYISFTGTFLLILSILAPTVDASSQHYRINHTGSVCIRPYFDDEENAPAAHFTNSANNLKKSLVLFGSSSTKEGMDYLYWAVAPEKNNAKFEIQKLFHDKWEFIAGLSSVGNSEQLSYYNIPVNHDEGINFYRIKQTDIDGRYSFSEVFEVDWNGQKMNIGNNPQFTNPNADILVVLKDDDGNTFAFKTEIKYENGSLYAIHRPYQLIAGNYTIVGSSTNIFDGAVLVLK